MTLQMVSDEDNEQVLEKRHNLLHPACHRAPQSDHHIACHHPHSKLEISYCSASQVLWLTSFFYSFQELCTKKMQKEHQCAYMHVLNVILLFTFS